VAQLEEKTKMKEEKKQSQVFNKEEFKKLISET